MFRTVRGAVAALALIVVGSTAGCGGDVPSEPTSGSPLNGDWVGDYNDYDIQLSLHDRGGAVTGAGKYIVGTTVRQVTVAGTSVPASESPLGDAHERDFSLTVAGDGVPPTVITGTTSHTGAGDSLFELLPAYVTNAEIGSNVYIAFARP